MTSIELTALIAIVAVDEIAVFCTEVAVMVALPDVGTVAGAV
jgi:hypothetical protein